MTRNWLFSFSTEKLLRVKIVETHGKPCLAALVGAAHLCFRLQGLCMSPSAAAYLNDPLAAAYSSTADFAELYSVRRIQETRCFLRSLPQRERQTDYWNPAFDRRATPLSNAGEFDG